MIYLLGSVEPGEPNLNYCLLYQKMQMLNCCIEKKVQREKRTQPIIHNQKLDATDIEEDSEDEFFDCEEQEQGTTSSTTGLKNSQPSGRLKKHGDLVILSTGEPMYVPELQEPPPYTEDIIAQQAAVLTELGDDAQG